MIQLSHYNKAIVAVAGLVLLQLSGIPVDGVNPAYNEAAQIVISLLTAWGVYQVDNAPLKKRKR